MTGDSVVGTVTEVDPLSSKVLLINDPTSRLTAQVQTGRWWAIAVGTLTRLKLRATFLKTPSCASAMRSSPVKAVRSTPAFRSDASSPSNR